MLPLVREWHSAMQAFDRKMDEYVGWVTRYHGEARVHASQHNTMEVNRSIDVVERYKDQAETLLAQVVELWGRRTANGSELRRSCERVEKRDRLPKEARATYMQKCGECVDQIVETRNRIDDLVAGMKTKEAKVRVLAEQTKALPHQVKGRPERVLDEIKKALDKTAATMAESKRKTDGRVQRWAQRLASPMTRETKRDFMKEKPDHDALMAKVDADLHGVEDLAKRVSAMAEAAEQDPDVQRGMKAVAQVVKQIREDAKACKDQARKFDGLYETWVKNFPMT
jgi:chromosome segregation ATPase